MLCYLQCHFVVTLWRPILKWVFIKRNTGHPAGLKATDSASLLPKVTQETACLFLVYAMILCVEYILWQDGKSPSSPVSMEALTLLTWWCHLPSTMSCCSCFSYLYCLFSVAILIFLKSSLSGTKPFLLPPRSSNSLSTGPQLVLHLKPLLQSSLCSYILLKPNSQRCSNH